MMDLRAEMKTVDLMLKFLRGDMRHIAAYPFVPQKQPPAPLPDFHDLPRSTPEAEGIPSGYLRDFYRELDVDPLVRLHGVMVLRHGKIISEGSWKPYTSELPHSMFSLSKSVVSMAVGMAVNEGLLRLDEKIVGVFPDRMPLLRSPRMNAVTVKHLLTMTSGVRFNEINSVTDRDWVRGFLQSDCAFEPGTQFAYNSMNTYMLSAAICRRSGMGLMQYLEPRLWRPLKIRGISWETCPMGIEKGGWGLSLRLADMAKLGQLYLQGGVWSTGEATRHLVPESWVHASVHSQRPGMPEDGTNSGYGYQIWTFEAKNAYMFNGMFGQYVVVLPERDMVVAVQSGSQHMFADDSLGLIARYFGDDARGISDDPLRPDARQYAALQNTLGSLYAIHETAPKPQRFTFLPRFLQALVPAPKGKPMAIPEFIGRSYRLENEFGSLPPLILQCVSNNFCTPISTVAFSFEPGLCRVQFADGEDTNEVAAGLDGIPRSGKVTLNSEVYAVGCTARLAEDEEDRPVLKLFISFIETPFTRIMKFIFYDDKILIRFDELPNVEAATAVMFEAMEGEGGGLKKLLMDTISRERLTRSLDRLLLPRAKGQRDAAPSGPTS